MTDSTRYRVNLDPAAAKDLAKLDKPTGRRIADRIRALADDPRPPGVKPLVSQPGQWRIRVGDYRVIYVIEDDVLVVLVLRVAHRSKAYQRR